MKKITSLSFIVLASALIILTFITYLVEMRASYFLSDMLSKKMGTEVKIGSVSISFGSVTVKEIEVSNPKDAILPTAFKADSITISASLFSLLSDQIRIKEIAIDKILLGLEFNSPSSTDGNWTQLMHGFQSGKKETSASKKSLFIETLQLNHISTRLVYKTDPSNIRSLPEISHITLKNISSEGGVPLEQLANSILGEMLARVFAEENLKNMLKDIIKEPSDVMNGFMSPFKSIIP